jgi:hypothetical protein
MAEKRMRADAQEGGHEGGLGGQTWVADREDVVMDLVQTSQAQPAPELCAREPEVLQLVARHHAELPRRESSQS